MLGEPSMAWKHDLPRVFAAPYRRNASGFPASVAPAPRSGIRSLFPLALPVFSALLILGSACSRAVPGKVWIEQWEKTSPMQFNRAGVGAVTDGKHIYAIGGGDYLPNGLRIYDTVEYAEVQNDGRLGPWRPTSPLNTTRIYVSTAVFNDTIYVMGGEGIIRFWSGAPGEDSPTLLNTVERAKILPDGQLGKWTLEKEKMQYARRGGQLFVRNGWLYAVGGFNGAFLRDVERAPIRPDGSLGPWVHEKNLTTRVRYISGYAQYNDRLYLFGGHLHSAEMAVSSVETAEVERDASVGEWKEISDMITRRFLTDSVRMDSTVYVLAGQNTVALTATEHAEIQPDGSLSPWESDTPLNVPRRAAGAVRVGDALYVLGGMNGPIGRATAVNSVELAYRKPGARLGHWVDAGSPEIAAYRTWKTAVPVDSVSHLQEARSALEVQRFKAALFDISEALRLDPSSYEAYNIRADAYFRMGKVPLAKEALGRSLQLNDHNFNALFGMGNILANEKKYETAVGYFQKAVEAKPDSVQAHEQLGKIYLEVGKDAAAEAEFRWVLQKDPNDAPARKLLDLSHQQAKSKG
jgi:Flp pilus assembly protein TadD